jgi:hypothetical protein
MFFIYYFSNPKYWIECISSVSRLAKFFEEALEKYFRQEFAAVIEACERLLKIFPDDAPTKNLLERARMFLLDPPATDWDGTWVMNKK